METAHGSESRTTRTRRSLQRKPLADLTNTPSAAAAAASSLLKPKPSDPKPSRSLARSTFGIDSRGSENAGNEGINTSTPKAKEASANPGFADTAVFVLFGSPGFRNWGHGSYNQSLRITFRWLIWTLVLSRPKDGDSVTHDKAEDSIVNKRRSTAGRKDKGKAVAAFVSSCPPIGRTRQNEGKLNAEDDEVDLPTTISVPYKKIKRRRGTMPLRKHLLPQDFVEKQRSYFAEIDAFELQEEEVLESELD